MPTALYGVPQAASDRRIAPFQHMYVAELGGASFVLGPLLGPPLGPPLWLLELLDLPPEDPVEPVSVGPPAAFVERTFVVDPVPAD